jgi:hypothetical protein
VSSDRTASSSRLRLSADQARAVALLLNATVKLGEPVLYSDVDIIDFVRMAAPPAAPLLDATVAESLTARLRERFGDDGVPDGLEQHLADLSDDALSRIAARTEAARSLRDLLGSHYPASEPLPSPLRSLPEIPRDGTEVWLLVSSLVEMPVDEFIVASWDGNDGRWVSDMEVGLWRRYDSDVKGWLPLDAPKDDPTLRSGIRRRWYGSDKELRGRLGEDGGAD